MLLAFARNAHVRLDSAASPRTVSPGLTMTHVEDHSVYRKVAEIIRDLAGKRAPSEIVPSTRLVDDLGFDSIMAIRIMLEIEKVFGIDVASRSDEIDIAGIATVEDLASVVQKLS
jgi:acyl carrier protein